MPGTVVLTHCTVHDGKGGRCGQLDFCMLVRTVLPHTAGDGSLVVAHEHRVCAGCRTWMGLPHYDVAVTPDGMIPIPDDGTIPAV